MTGPSGARGIASPTAIRSRSGPTRSSRARAGSCSTITTLVRDQAKAGRTGHGVLLRFLSEDFNNGPPWSGYDLVSREGAGEWASRRPVLLVVKDEKAEKAKAK